MTPTLRAMQLRADAAAAHVLLAAGSHTAVILSPQGHQLDAITLPVRLLFAAFAFQHLPGVQHICSCLFAVLWPCVLPERCSTPIRSGVWSLTRAVSMPSNWQACVRLSLCIKIKRHIGAMRCLYPCFTLYALWKTPPIAGSADLACGVDQGCIAMAVVMAACTCT